MSKRQLFALFACSLIFFTNGNALMGLLPVYITRLGADPSVTGYYFSVAFFAVGVGTILTGWLSDRFQRRKLLLIVSGAAIVPMMWLMGQAVDIAQLTFFTALNWFVSGIAITSVNILAGLSATEDERGQVFGLLSSGVAIGGLLAGLTSGQIVDRWGFPMLFNLVALLAVLFPVIGLFVEEHTAPPSKPKEAGVSSPSFTFTRGFVLLFIASIIAFLVNSTGALARPLIMTELQFDATAISGAVAVGGLIGLPLPFLVGWLSDRIGRKPLLILCYLANMLGLLMLISAIAPWHFWLSSALQLSMAASAAVGSALITDLVPRESLGVSLSLFTSTNSIGFVIGFAGTGIAMQQFGTPATLMLGIVLSLISAALLMFIRTGGRKRPIEQVATATPIG
jgi:MFS family permease